VFFIKDIRYNTNDENTFLELPEHSDPVASSQEQIPSQLFTPHKRLMSRISRHNYCQSFWSFDKLSSLFTKLTHILFSAQHK